MFASCVLFPTSSSWAHAGNAMATSAASARPFCGFMVDDPLWWREPHKAGDVPCVGRGTARSLDVISPGRVPNGFAPSARARAAVGKSRFHAPNAPRVEATHLSQGEQVLHTPRISADVDTRRFHIARARSLVVCVARRALLSRAGVSA